MMKDDVTAVGPAQLARELIPLSAHATGAKLRLSSSPTRSVRPIAVHLKEPDGTAWRVITVTVDGIARGHGDPPYPVCRGNCWIDIEVECPHDHPPTEAKPIALHGVVLCEANDLPVSAGDTERDRQWAMDFRKPHGARKLSNGEWETTFRGDSSPSIATPQDSDGTKRGARREVKAATDEQMETLTDQQVQSFARLLVHGIYRDLTAFDPTQALSFMQAILRRIVGEQIVAIESLGGLGGWSRDNLGKLLSDAAEIELGQVLGTFSQAFEFEMKMHAGPTAEPTSAPQAARESVRQGDVVTMKPRASKCTNDPAAKAREVSETFDKVCRPESPYLVPMRTLFLRGAFRHAEDVAFARIMLERGGDVDAIEDEIKKSYRDVNHRCDPVYPS